MTRFSLLFVAACTPLQSFEHLQASEYGASMPEAFPGARADGFGVGDFEFPDGGTYRLEYATYDGIAVANSDVLLGNATDFQDRAAVTLRRFSRWENCTVPFEDRTSSPTARQHFEDSAARFTRLTGLHFVEAPLAQDRVVLSGEIGCSSFIGRIGGPQQMNLGSCERTSFKHEIGHVLGLFHEHNRTDRDEHVTVHPQNIRPELLFAFAKHETREPGIDHGPYDLRSMMHYPATGGSLRGACRFFDTTGCSLTHADGTYLNDPQQEGLTLGDITAVRAMYPECTPNEDDHGNLLATATPHLVSGERTAFGAIEFVGDRDVFALTLSTSGPFTVFTTFADTPLNTTGNLYDSSGRWLGEDETSGPLTNLQFTHTGEAGEVFFLEVSGSLYTNTGPYILHTVSEANSLDEPDVTLDLHSGSEVAAVDGFLDPGASDLYIVQIDSPQPALLTVRSLGSTDTVGTLQTEDGEVLDVNDDTEGLNFEVESAVEPGRYTVEVRGFSSGTTGAYTLEFEASTL